jgi:hypothetical protein
MSVEKPEPKARLNLYISQPVVDRLWDYIKKKYKVPTKKLSHVIEQAIIEFLENHKE